MSVKMRQEVEQKIVGALVDSLLADGYRISVSLERGYDIDDMTANGVLGTRDRAKIMEEAFAGDECHLFVHDAVDPLIVDDYIDSFGWVYVVFGNDGWDCISDYTVNLEPLMTDAKAISDHYAS